MAMIGHPIHNDHRYTYGHAAQVGLCKGRKQGGRATPEDPCEVSDDSSSSAEEECVADKLEASEAEVQPGAHLQMADVLMCLCLLAMPFRLCQGQCLLALCQGEKFCAVRRCFCCSHAFLHACSACR